MKTWKATYSVWSFFWNAPIQFEMRVQGRSAEEAQGAVLAHNRLAEDIKVQEQN